MDTEVLMNGLLELGMNQREAKVYLVMLTKHDACLADLERLSGFRASKVSEIAGSLVRKGYCKERKVGRRRYFDAFDPLVSFTAPLSKMESQVARGQELSRALSDLYADAPKAEKPLEYIEILHGKNNIHDHYCRLIQNAKEEILAFVRPPYACDVPKKVKEQRLAYDAFLGRGGLLRWVFEISNPGQKERAQGLEHLVEKGAKIGFIEKLPLKLMVFDRQEVLVAQKKTFSRSGELTMALMKHGAIADAFRTLFLYFFTQSMDYDMFMRKGTVTEGLRRTPARARTDFKTKRGKRPMESDL
jgi:hypothetical protein